MRILVCGGREFDDWALLNSVLTEYVPEDAIIIQGGAKGADFLAKVWAKFKMKQSIEFAADWKKYGKMAGHIRNQKMLDEGKPNLVIAFPGGNGTKDMVQKAYRANIKIIQVR